MERGEEAADRLSCNRTEHICDWVGFKGVAEMYDVKYRLHTTHTHTLTETHRLNTS